MVLGIIAAALAVVVLFVVLASDDDDDVATDSTTTTEPAETSTSEPGSTTTTEDETTTSTTEDVTTTEATSDVTDQEAATIAWPDPDGADLFDDPLDAVASFAEDLVGFVDPVYSELQQGDARSGEVEVRAVDDGPVTTVAVRQMSDGNWYVLFAASTEVELTEPTAGSAIDHPLQVGGEARAFEGQVRIAVHLRGEPEPLGEGFVTAGSGADLEPFTGEIAWENPGGGWGAVVASVADGEDGSTWAATAIPVGFIGAD